MDSRLKSVKEVRDGIIVFTDGSELIPHADRMEIGVGVELSPKLQLGMPGKPIEVLKIGDHTRIHEGIIAPRVFACGDYVTIHAGVWCYGRGTALIGHNSWFGMRCTLDAEGSFYVGNGFGAGQDTHLWSHIRHGDIGMGCKYLSFSRFRAENDVWFVGRCTSGPTGDGAHAQFSVALTESNVTKPMEMNHVYGGNPAKDLTERIGEPYAFTTPEQRSMRFNSKIMDFIRAHPTTKTEQILEVAARFSPGVRTYVKHNDDLEIKLMRFLLPEYKFVPRAETIVTVPW